MPRPDRPVLRLRRLEWHGYAAYQTRDGRFTVEQGGNGVGSWCIVAASESLDKLLVCAEMDRAFDRLKDAREALAYSNYAAPYGWLHQPTEAVAQEFNRKVMFSEMNP